MAYINIADQPVTLYALLQKEIAANIGEQCTNILTGVCKGLQCIHRQNFLHNDLKLDNIVLGTTSTKQLKPYIIDFGTARKGKIYSLNESGRERFKIEHTHIAPDLRDGLVSQSFQTDVYSYGRVLRRCNSIIIQSPKLKVFCRQVLSYHSNDRPCLDSILSFLSQI